MEADPLYELRVALNVEARRGCFCAKTTKPCERHDAFDDGIVAVVDRLERVLDIDGNDWGESQIGRPVYKVTESFPSAACPDCGGSGEVVVRFAHAVQRQDCLHPSHNAASGVDG